MNPFALLAGKVAIGVVLSLIAANSPGAEDSHETRTASKTNEWDRDENGVIDSYWEEFSLGEGLTLRTTERLKEATGEVEIRLTHIMRDGQPLWQEVWRPADQSRSHLVFGSCPFDIGFDISESTGEGTLSLTDDKSRHIAWLIRKKGGRLAPVTDEELERLRKVTEAVTEFATDILERPDELMEDKEEAGKVVQKLKQAVDEYNQDADDSAEKSIKSEDENKAEESATR
jgi:hypothetical protein